MDYSGKEYIERHPTYHVEDSEWKAAQISKMIRRHGLTPRLVCDVGCGAGAVLAGLQRHLPQDARLVGYDLSPELAQLWSVVANARLSFVQGDFLSSAPPSCDLLLCLDVFEHVADYLGFLTALREKAELKLFHIPLDMNAQAVLRGTPIRQTALLTLADTGYTIVDWFYTPSGVERPTSFAERLARWPRRLVAAFDADVAARVLGGYSMLILAR
jgi:SAM-dependent methyltransferase